MISLGIINPKSPDNMGSILRAAGCYRAQQIFYTGTRYQMARAFHTDTNNVNKHIPLTHCQNLLDQVPPNTKIVTVELVEGATPLPLFTHPDRAFYIFGPEDGSVEQPLIDRSDAVVYVPTHGCMNLAASVNVLLYDRLAKSKNTDFSSELIIKSRDNNNRTRVRTD